MAELVTLERHGDIAVLVIDNPPVNALSQALRQALLGALQGVFGESSYCGAVLACAGNTFVAGADIREFDQPPGPVVTNDICAALDGAPKPVVAALHGTTLGGGFELALACHARILAPDGRVGLPEVRIGLIPGAGGTVRATYLAGAMAALDIAGSGRHVPAAEALQLGLVDEVATDIRAAAIDRAQALAALGHWPRVRDRALPACDRAGFDKQATGITKRARGAVAPGAVASAIGNALDLPFDEAIARERDVSVQLRSGEQSKALRHIFHAERVAARMAKVDGQIVKTWPVRKAAVIGGGTMGSGITIALVDSGLPVILIETSDAALQAAEGRIRAVYDRHVKTGRITAAGHAERMARIHFSTEITTVADSDLIIEAIIEELKPKQDIFKRLSGIVRRDCILASNTSRLDINLLADMVDAPERVLGLHFFSPAHVMRLLEIVRAERTLPEVIATALALARRIGKQPVISGVCDGFIGNRILSRWRLQTDFMLEDGAYPQDVDAAIEAYGFAMGPYAVADLAGLDIGWAGRKRAAPTRDPRARYVPISDWICELGRFGQKTGAGYYRHVDGKREIDPVVTALVERASAERQIIRRALSPADIQARVHAAMVNEAAKILAEGIAQRPSDIDVVLVGGYGYPAWRGGPMHEADRIGLATMLRRIEAMHEADGIGWEPAPLLREMVHAGKTFADLNA